MKIAYVVILWIGASILLSGCQSTATDNELVRLEALQKVKRLALVCHLYAQDNDGMLPGTMTELQPYADDFHDLDAYELVAIGKLKEIESNNDSSTIVLLRQKDLLPDGQQAVAFVDGHAEIVPIK